ncbi:MAG: 4Fe-4S dicluster domain-containing protein [Candidatus Woesearchaeota archaeon]
MNFFLKKEDLRVFLGSLGAHEVIAPVRHGRIVVFKKYEETDIIDTTQNAYYPPKQFFLPNPEELFSFSRLKFLTLSMEKITPKINRHKRIIFGIRLCDIKALQLLDKFYLSEPIDIYYKSNRENTILIAIRCKEPEQNCFCSSFNIKDEGYDMLFEEIFNGFLVKTGSKVGENLKDNHLFKETQQEISPHCKTEKNLKSKDIIVNSPVYENYSKDCLSCCACNIVCPTCSCFDIRDRNNINLRTGKRERIWDYCQSQDYTKVAGGGVFRKDRNSRFKHRLLCKFKYFKENFGDYSCTGCGRCITSCLTNICDIPKILGEVQKREKNE